MSNTGGVTPRHPIGRVETRFDLETFRRCCLGAACDYVRVTVGSSAAMHLLARTDHEQPGSPSRGFKSAERRTTMGGTCLRKFDPHTPSNAHHLEYESWEWTGCTARHGINLAASVIAKATRIDVAFDFPVEDDFYPDDLLNALRPGITTAGYAEDSIRAAGPLRTGTRYVGSPASSKQFRIYRRDLKSGEGSSVIRVELEATEDAALALWATLKAHDLEAMHRAAASMIEGMCGWSPIEPGPIERLPPEHPTAIDDTVLALVRQFGDAIAFLLEHGVPIDAIVCDRRQDRNRMARSRWNRWARLLEESGGPDALAERVRAVLGLQTGG